MSPSRKFELFGEYQINHMVATFRHIDRLLEMIQTALTNNEEGLFPRYVHNLDAEREKELLAFVAELRARMATKMKKYGLAMPPPKTTASHAVESALSFIGIALDDLRPKEMRGYGPVNETAAKELEELIHELQVLTTSAVRSLKIQDEGVAS